ncbi:KPN_02809 family neutral zinc metallopeptidase [Ancylobacter polymorphus]|uniref:Neutral zinc metallopeptidase n=1 Tax=Ancylobacter polymorphus TaxID=223390 RepID=A0A9E7CX20_9HYPH|nr:neutral zinc metallopeptidase [Ancylobacter polymorphus]UOK71814.1 neutral zinc metallopeptidase [Ancylobacter polymorphus]
MRWEDFRRSGNVEDRRGGGFGGGGGMGRGGLGIGGLIIVGLIAWATGINPAVLIGGAEILLGDGSPSSQTSPQRQSAPPRNLSAEDQKLGDFAAVVLAQTEDVWKPIFKGEGATYREPGMVLFTGATRSACGAADAAVGPFYCPRDQKVYLDTSFFKDLKRRFNAPGDFAAAYVIAHEVGHHVENQIGLLEKVQARQRQVSRSEANALSVRVELMADCLAGVWAHHADAQWRILEDGDIEEAMNAAAAIGDDRLQKQAQGYVVPDSFTHGTSAQRVKWFRQGLAKGSLAQCNTFKGSI